MDVNAPPGARCQSCGHVHFPPRSACPSCAGRALEQVPLSTGVLEAVVVTRRSAGAGEPGRPGQPGQALAAVRTDHGPVLVVSLDAWLTAGQRVVCTVHDGRLTGAPI